MLTIWGVTSAVPVAIYADAAYAAQQKIGVQCPGHSGAVGQVGIVLVVVLAAAAGHFRGVGGGSARDAVADKLDKRSL
uniref:Uncharacterized protein n=1 Tax=Tanacetum cinerariifolium TaxID=118510 RepID=A0A699Q611_TANCI|nr:hypothetical protein [Tanacetum cinerariifolium]